jgi:hypothetical protein
MGPDVGHFLDGVERNARRQEDPQRRDRNVVEAQARERRRERVDKEVEYLERAEEAQVHDERERQRRRRLFTSSDDVMARAQ